MEPERKVAELIAKSENGFVALTGAGISAESGIPTFRGENGLWKKYKPEELATFQAFVSNPRLVWEWYSWRLERVLKATPNKAHKVIAELERRGYVKAVITQNVDDLHERAGSRNVVHLHGRIDEARCLGCGKIERLSEPPSSIPPKCGCGEIMRPNVVWFGEPLRQEDMDYAVRLCMRHDVLVIGTSSVVYPAASLPYYSKEMGKIVVEINPESTPLSAIADITIRKKAGLAFERIATILKEEGFL